MNKRFVLLDRDGTIIEETLDRVTAPNQVRLLPRAGEALWRLKEHGLGLVVITNQSVVGRGMVDVHALDRIHSRMKELLRLEGATLDGIYYCPHKPEENCSCRKPGIGLAEQACRELGFAASDSFVIGDKDSDIELGRRVGATTFLVRTGYSLREKGARSLTPDYVVDDLYHAVLVIESLINPGKS